jgi:hypothetical protein
MCRNVSKYVYSLYIDILKNGERVIQSLKSSFKIKYKLYISSNVRHCILEEMLRLFCTSSRVSNTRMQQRTIICNYEAFKRVFCAILHV